MHYRKKYFTLSRRRRRGEAVEEEPDGVASGMSIDLSIQFLLFWMPVLVLVAWFAHKPLTMLFDLLEVALLVAACFMVNYVTADSKTNWAEGLAMVVFYVIIVSTGPLCWPPLTTLLGVGSVVLPRSARAAHIRRPWVCHRVADPWSARGITEKQTFGPSDESELTVWVGRYG